MGARPLVDGRAVRLRSLARDPALVRAEEPLDVADRGFPEELLIVPAELRGLNGLRVVDEVTATRLSWS